MYPARYSIDWQCIFLLLYSINPLINGATKEQVLFRIEDNQWFAIHEDDLLPYPSASNRGSSEARWMTLIAYARDHAKTFGLISNESRNNWKITDTGSDLITKFKEKISTKEIRVARCFLWSPIFKATLDSTYIASDEDAARPSVIYQDLNPLNDLI